MKAFMVTAPGRTAIGEIPIPTPGPYDALCRTQFAGICAGTDTHVINGVFGPRSYPLVLGHESIGKVVDVGYRVSSFRVGDLITRVGVPSSPDGLFDVAWGGVAEYGIARDAKALEHDGHPEAEWRTACVNRVITSGLSPVYTPMYITWRETLSYTSRLGIAARDHVVVAGSGANGLSIAAMAQLLGAGRVTVIGSPSRKEAAELIGVHRLIPYRDDAAVQDFVAEASGTVSVIVDAVGISHSLDRLLPLLRRDGAIGVYGLDDLDSYAVNPRRAQSFRYLDPGYDEGEAHEAVEGFIRTGGLNARVWIDQGRTFTWQSIDAAYAAARDRSLIKPVIDVTKGA